jgi:hypothetical protein
LKDLNCLELRNVKIERFERCHSGQSQSVAGLGQADAGLFGRVGKAWQAGST